jgi:hypothetical protein
MGSDDGRPYCARWRESIRTGLERGGHRGASIRHGRHRLANSTLASLQRGLVLTQAWRDPQQLRRALDGALRLIELYRTA